MAVTPPVSLAQFKVHINLTGTADDVELTQKLLAATLTVEQMVGAMMPRAVTDLVMTVYYEDMALPQWPVLSIESVRDAVDADDPNLLLRGRNLPQRPQRVISYTVGRNPVPADLQEATLIVAGHMWDTQRGGFVSNGPPIGIQPQAVRGPFSTFSVPARAMELLSSHMPPAIA